MKAYSLFSRYSCCPVLRKVLGIICLPGLFLVQSCGSHPGPMTGNWALSLVSSGSLEQAVAALRLNQSGDTISGTITSSLCTTETTTLTGTLTGANLTLQFAGANASGTLTGTVNNNFTLISGTYSASGNWCVQASGPGTWTASFLSG